VASSPLLSSALWLQPLSFFFFLWVQLLNFHQLFEFNHSPYNCSVALTTLLLIVLWLHPSLFTYFLALTTLLLLFLLGLPLSFICSVYSSVSYPTFTCSVASSTFLLSVLWLQPVFSYILPGFSHSFFICSVASVTLLFINFQLLSFSLVCS